MAFVTSSFFAITPQQLTQVLSRFTTLTTTGGADEASAWNFEYQGLLVEGSGFTYNGTRPTGGSIDRVSQGGVFSLSFDDIALATFVQLASTPDTLIRQIFSGDDFLIGSFDADRLNGFAGDDAFLGGGSVDVMDGGAGSDTASYVGTLVPVRVTLNGSSFARVTLGGAADDLIRNIENVNSGSGADVLRGDGLANALRGQGGNDMLLGGGGLDVLEGGTGIDTVDCTDKMAALRITLGGAGPGSVKAGGVTEESLFQIENVLGGRGRDIITGDQFRNELSGGPGSDNLTGGLGADRFDFNATGESPRGAGRDTVNFIRRQGDKIDLFTIDADTDGTPGNQAFRFIGAAAFSGTDGQLRFSAGILQGDVNGDRVADLEIRVVGALLGGDIIL